MMNLKRLVSLLLLIVTIGLVYSLNPLPAWADWSTPLKFNHAQVKNRGFAGQQLPATEFSNANLEYTTFEYADLRGALFSGSVMTEVNFHGADLSNALLDFATFNSVDLSNANLTQALLLQSTFDDASNITGADFTDAILDGKQIESLCQQADGVNSTTGISTRASLGCP
ncbi:MAG: pentapeptide repeat-containing protein [Thainema sp.]